MRTLCWMQRIFTQKNNEKSRNISARKSYPCFSSIGELDEQQHYSETNSAHLRQPTVCQVSPIAPEAREVEKVNEENTAEMNPELFHGFLAIGTLGSMSMAQEAITPEAAITKEETSATGNVLKFPSKKLEKLMKKKVHDDDDESCKGPDTKENKNKVVYPLKEYSEMPATKEDAEEEKTMLDKLFKKNATSYKRSGKLDKGEKRETHALHFMKKLLKKLNVTSQCSPTSAGGFASFGSSTKKNPTKVNTKGGKVGESYNWFGSERVFRKSRKIHPETADFHATKSYNNKVKKVSHDKGYDKEVILEEEDYMYPQDETLKKETVNNQPTEQKAHWINTDADYFVLEF